MAAVVCVGVQSSRRAKMFALAKVLVGIVSAVLHRAEPQAHLRRQHVEWRTGSVRSEEGYLTTPPARVDNASCTYSRTAVTSYLIQTLLHVSSRMSLASNIGTPPSLQGRR